MRRGSLVLWLALLLLLAACEAEATETPAGDDDSAPVAARTSEPESTATAQPEEPTVTPAAAIEATAPEPTATAAPADTPVDEPVTDAFAGMTSATVTQIVDGDTLDVEIDGQKYSVRIIGVDTPETKDPNQPVMCFGPEATAFTMQMIEQADYQIYLEQDVSDTDRYGRLLRYVWLPHEDGTRMLNQELVAQGYAQSSSYPPDVKYQDRFVVAQQEAREAGRGLWGGCGGFGVPLEEPTTEPSGQPEEPSGECDPSYPDVCIAPYPPDLNCGDIPFGSFTVLPPDPHGFDGSNENGLGCESN